MTKKRGGEKKTKKEEGEKEKEKEKNKIFFPVEFTAEFQSRNKKSPVPIIFCCAISSGGATLSAPNCSGARVCIRQPGSVGVSPDPWESEV